MANSVGGESASGPGGTGPGGTGPGGTGTGGTGQGGPPPGPSFTPSSPPASKPHEPTEVVPPGEGPLSHPATEASDRPPAGEATWGPATVTVGRQQPGDSASANEPAGSRDARAPGTESLGGTPELHRSGPGVPSAAPASQSGIPAADVWRNGKLPRPPGRRKGGPRRAAGTALTIALLIAAGVVAYLRLHHAPLSVTGVAITSQAKNGCAVNVTGRISTTGGAGTVSYQWVFTPQVTAPQPLSQSVTAGQSSVYVTVSAQGTGHGQLTQQVTLQVLGPGQGSASTHVNLSC